MKACDRDPVSEALIKAKQHEKELTQSRCIKRINKIIDTINNELEHFGGNVFNVSASDRNQMINDVLTYISKWNGGKNYRKYTENWKCCHTKVVRAWWNRVKCWKLGDYVLGPLIKLFFKFVVEMNGITRIKKTKIFIGVLMVLLNTKIKYPRSMARPIIPIQIFVKKNVFRDFCEEFVFGLGVEWQSESINNRYLPNPNRSGQLFQSYINCLELITTRINVSMTESMTDMSIETEASSHSSISVPENNNNIYNNSHVNTKAARYNGENNGYMTDINMQPTNNIFAGYIHPNNNPNIPPFPNLTEIILPIRSVQSKQMNNFKPVYATNLSYHRTQSTQNIANNYYNNQQQPNGERQLQNRQYHQLNAEQQSTYQIQKTEQNQSNNYHAQTNRCFCTHCNNNCNCNICDNSYKQPYFNNFKEEINNQTNQYVQWNNTNNNFNNNHQYT